MEISPGNNVDLERLAVEVLSKNFDGTKNKNTENILVKRRKDGPKEDEVRGEESIHESYALRWSDERVEPSSEFTIGTKVMLRTNRQVGSVTLEKAGGWRVITFDDGTTQTCRSVFTHDPSRISSPY